MKRLFLLFLAFLCACTLLQRRERPVEWPSGLEHLEGIGDLDMNWKGTAYAGSASVKMEYPDYLVLEVYGAFGQTLMHLKKDREGFLFVGDEKIKDQQAFEERYGLKLAQFMSDLAIAGEKRTLAQGFAIQRDEYEVVYDSDSRGRSRICWKGKEGHICLAFDEIDFAKGEPSGEGSRGRR